MTTNAIGRWLLVTLAIVGIALLAPAVGAHGTEWTAADAHPSNATAEGWATWMEAQMTGHMGPGAVEWMEAHMGTTVEEMGRFMADGGPGAHGMDVRGAGTYAHGGMAAGGGGC